MISTLLRLLPLLIGATGVIYQCLVFIKKTIPENHGNPGFGCLEVKVIPWFALVCVGISLLQQSLIWGIAVFVPGVFGFGFLAILLGNLFGNR